MTVNIKHVEEVEKLQKEVIAIRYQNKELLSIIEGYKDLEERQSTNFDAMVYQRDEFLKLAKNLDREFNQGKLFSK